MSHQRNISQNYNDLPLQIHSDGYNKNDIIPSIGNDVDKLETSFTAVGNVKWGPGFGKHSGSWFQRLSIELPHDPRIPRQEK